MKYVTYWAHSRSPESGYYEWKATKDGTQPFYMTSSIGPILSIADLWNERRDIESGESRSYR